MLVEEEGRMGTLTLKTIMQAFICAENKFPRHIQNRFFALTDSFSKRSNAYFKVKKTEQKGFFDFWVPESFTNCFGKAGIELSDDQIRHISAGRKKKVIETLQSQFENNSSQMFWDYKEYIDKIIERHIKVYVCVKNKGPSIFDGEAVTITESELNEEIKTKAEEYENTLKAFKKEMLKSILTSPDYLSDERINKFYEILTDEKTILSIFGLFAAATVENEEYYINRIFKKLYDEKTNELKPCPKTKDYQINIDREAIWKAGKNWYEESKKEGNRFAKLFPDTALLPLVGTIPIYVHSTDKKEKPLMDTILKNPGHLYLIGEGGIGKTTALYSIMEDAYANREEQISQQVPLFIELSRAYKSKDFDLDRGESKFIRNTVQNQLQISLNTKADLGMLIEEEYQKNTNKQEYILLLDGLNEVSREAINGHVILGMVVAEITYIMANYKNVRVILTSRSEEYLEAASTSVYLSGIKPEQIEIYLKEKGVSRIRINETIANTQLMEILRIPLFLTMYAELDEDIELLSRGEILHAFFSKTNKERYTEKNRIKTINSNFAKETGIDRSEGSKECITPHMLNFILDFIMPQIAWNMAKENEFQITRREINKAIKQVLTDKTETSFISEYGIESFSEYSNDEKDNTKTTVDRIRRVFGKNNSNNWSLIISMVRDCLTKQFGLLVKNDYKEYEVLHQHIRDYFAALYHINKLKLAVYIHENGDRDDAIECLSGLVKEPLPGQILVFIGEALGELHNVPELNEETNEWIRKKPERRTERDLIDRCFDIFRGINNDNYAVWNLFQILKLVREDLSGADFSGLDLRKCRANGYRLGNQTFAAKFDNAILANEFFMPIGHSSNVVSAEYSPDGKYIVSAAFDRTAKVWDAKTFNEIPGGTLTGHNGWVNSAVYSPDGKYIVTASDDKTAKVWDAKAFEEIPGGTLKGHKGAVRSAVYSPDCKYIITASEDTTAKVWDAKTFEEVLGGTLKGHKGAVRSAVYSPDCKYIITASEDMTAKVWDAKTFKEIPSGTLRGHRGLVVSAVFSPDGRFIVTAAWDRTAKVWDTKTFTEVPNGTLLGHKDWLESAIFSPNGKYIVTTSRDGTAKVWDAKTFKEVPGGSLVSNNGWVSSAVYSPDEKHLLMVSYNGNIKVWESKTFKEVPGEAFVGYLNSVYTASYSPDGKYIVTASDDKTAKVWDAKTFKAIPGGTLKGHKGAVRSAVYSPNGKYIVTASADKTAKVWDAKTFKVVPRGTLIGHNDWVSSAIYSPDGKYIVTSSLDTTAKVWNTDTYEETNGGTLIGHKKWVRSAAYSPDGKYIMTTSMDKTVKVWDAKTFKEVPRGVLRDSGVRIESAVYSPDGKNILTSSFDGTTKVWDAKTFKRVPNMSLRVHGEIAYTAVYSPDGEYIMTSSSNGPVEVWNAKTCTIIPGGTLIGHKVSANSAVYSPDGKYIVTASYDGTVMVWNAKNYKEIHTINNVPGLEVWNVDIRKLNVASSISDNTKKILEEYGAIVE